MTDDARSYRDRLAELQFLAEQLPPEDRARIERTMRLIIEMQQAAIRAQLLVEEAVVAIWSLAAPPTHLKPHRRRSSPKWSRRGHQNERGQLSYSRSSRPLNFMNCILPCRMAAA
jgi:hypothetical protein